MPACSSHPQLARSYARPGTLVCADCQSPIGQSPSAAVLELGGFVLASFVLPFTLLVVTLGTLFVVLGLFTLNLIGLVVGVPMLAIGALVTRALLVAVDLRMPRAMHWCAARQQLLDAPSSALSRLIAAAVLSAGTSWLALLAARQWAALGHYGGHAGFTDISGAAGFVTSAALSLLYAITLSRVVTR